MKVRKIQVTPDKVDELMALFRGLPTQPVGDHLTDEEFIAYAMGTLPADEVARLDVHLDSCLECAAEVERLQEAAAFWDSPEGRQRLANLRERVLKKLIPPLWERLAAALRNLVLLPNVGRAGAPAWAATYIRPQDGQTEDGVLRWRIVEDEEGNLVVRFGSHHLELEGVRVSLQAGDWTAEAVLAPVAPDQVGAEITIPWEERERLPAGADLRITHVQGRE